MIGLTPVADKLKDYLEKIVPEVIDDQQAYNETINLVSAFIGMLIARCVREDNQALVLQKVFELIFNYEAECRLNLDDIKLMIHHINTPK